MRDTISMRETDKREASEAMRKSPLVMRSLVYCREGKVDDPGMMSINVQRTGWGTTHERLIRKGRIVWCLVRRIVRFLSSLVSSNNREVGGKIASQRTELIPTARYIQQSARSVRQCERKTSRECVRRIHLTSLNWLVLLLWTFAQGASVMGETDGTVTCCQSKLQYKDGTQHRSFNSNFTPNLAFLKYGTQSS